MHNQQTIIYNAYAEFSKGNMQFYLLLYTESCLLASSFETIYEKQLTLMHLAFSFQSNVANPFDLV